VGSVSKTIIINPGRTGGTLLVGALDCHPQLRFTGEILNLHTPSIPADARKILENLHGPLPQIREKNSNQQISAAYIEQLLEIYDGFKMLYYELNQEIISYLLKRDDVKLIHLKRWNAMEHCISQLVASRTKIYHIGPHQRSYCINRLHVPPKSIGKYFKRYVNEQKRYDKILQGSMSVFYEDLIKNWGTTMKSIQKYIGVKLESLPITQGKVIGNPIQEVVENYREMYYHFLPTEHGKYFKSPILYL